MDHPEQELMDFDFITGSKSNLYESFTYVCRNFEEYRKELDEVNSEIQDLVNTVNKTDDIVEKHKLIFKWITSNVYYEQTDSDVGIVDFNDDEHVLSRLETNTTQNIYGAIVNKKAICDGCNCCNLECLIVDGYIGDINENRYHAWNLVKVDNEWYIVDATWSLGKNDSSYFMVKDLYKGDRTPIDIGYKLPGYSKTDETDVNTITFKDSSKKNEMLASVEIAFSQQDKNYEIYTNLSMIIDRRQFLI